MIIKIRPTSDPCVRGCVKFENVIHKAHSFFKLPLLGISSLLFIKFLSRASLSHHQEQDKIRNYGAINATACSLQRDPALLRLLNEIEISRLVCAWRPNRPTDSPSLECRFPAPLQLESCTIL